MSDSLDIWLANTALFRKVVHALSGESPPERLPDQVVLANGLTLNWVENPDELPDPESKGVSTAFLAACYDDLKEAAARSLRTVWFNPQGKLAPAALPIQDVDLLNLEGLSEIRPALLQKPSLAQCLDWWDAWEVPDNIRAHSRTVARSAYILAVLMRNQAIHIDPILTQRGGLLHDIDKIETLEQSSAHGRVGADFLTEQGYPAMAEIVEEHIMSTILHPHADDRRWEVKLVYFCDKLVEGDELVTFGERLNALFERYPHYREAMGRAARPVHRMSDEICSVLKIPSHKLLIARLRKLMGT